MCMSAKTAMPPYVLKEFVFQLYIFLMSDIYIYIMFNLIGKGILTLFFGANRAS